MISQNEIELLKSYQEKLIQAIGYLEYSYQKVLKLPTQFAKLDQETLETWESFSARFSRVADLFLSKYVRLYIDMYEPGFRGTMIDFINQAEKMRLLHDANTWIEIRKLRNATAHEYSDQAFDDYVQKILFLAPKLLELKAIITP